MASLLAAEHERDLDAVRAVLVAELNLSAATARGLGRDSALFGDLPELDSMAVARVLTAIEDRFGFVIDDDEVDGDLFATLGSLTDFVTAKR
jgi:acyl carrier protein